MLEFYLCKCKNSFVRQNDETKPLAYYTAQAGALLCQAHVCSANKRYDIDNAREITENDHVNCLTECSSDLVYPCYVANQYSRSFSLQRSLHKVVEMSMLICVA